MEEPKTPLSVDIEKQILLKFKSMCVLKETTMSEEVESLIREWVQKNDGTTAQKPEQPSSTEQRPAGTTPPSTDAGTTAPLGTPGSSPPGESAPGEKEKAFL